MDPALYQTCPGWTGPAPALMIDLVAAAEAEIACRRQMAGQLVTLAQTHGVAR